MLETELTNEFDNGVSMFGYNKNNKLVGVMGIQELKDVTLNKTCFHINELSKKGIGNLLLQYIFSNE